MSQASTAEPIVQGSAAWRVLRLGKITASQFSDVLAQPRVQGKGTAHSYLLDLVAEILTGQDQGPPTTWVMQWGTDNEPGARQVYSELTGLEVQEVGFLTHPEEPMVGGSPDGLVGDDGGLEIKCPANTRIHLGYMLGGELPKEHIAQVQGHLWISGRQWFDFVSYDPRIKDLRLALWRLRVQRDEAYIAKLEKAVFAFRDALMETLCNLKIGGNS